MGDVPRSLTKNTITAKTSTSQGTARSLRGYGRGRAVIRLLISEIQTRSCANEPWLYLARHAGWRFSH
jgi:hypothetical protein